MIPILFFCSGATALIYEVIWAKYLSLMFGSTVQAQTVVLAVFMGGLALGNSLFGNRADWLRHPLAGYGYIEAVIGLYAFFFDWFFNAADKVFVALGSSLLHQSLALLALKGALSVLLLLGLTEVVTEGGREAGVAGDLRGGPELRQRLLLDGVGVGQVLGQLISRVGIGSGYPAPLGERVTT